MQCVTPNGPPTALDTYYHNRVRGMLLERSPRSYLSDQYTSTTLLAPSLAPIVSKSKVTDGIQQVLSTRVCSDVVHALGVPDYKYPSYGEEAIMKELQKEHPNFEKVTGWKMSSAYKEMPKNLTEEVQ